MASVTYIGYHATTSKRGTSILKNGYNKSISKKLDDQWLGDGVYFWIDDYYAVEWLIIKHINKKMILKSKITTDKEKILDLSSPEGNVLYNFFIDELTKKYKDDESMQEAIEKNDDRIWMNILEDKGFFDIFDIVIATYKKVIINKHQEDDFCNFIKCEQKQICVKNINSIQQTIEYCDKERIDELKDIITFNRKREGVDIYE